MGSSLERDLAFPGTGKLIRDDRRREQPQGVGAVRPAEVFDQLHEHVNTAVVLDRRRNEDEGWSRARPRRSKPGAHDVAAKPRRLTNSSLARLAYEREGHRRQLWSTKRTRLERGSREPQ